MNKKNQKGFTLVELIVVIAIVAILAAVGIVGYTQFIQNARDSKAKAELDQVVNVLYAEALVAGIEVSKTEVKPETGGTLVLKSVSGKLVFVDSEGEKPEGEKKSIIDEDLLKVLLEAYAEDLKGTFTLKNGRLEYADAAGGKGHVIVDALVASDLEVVLE